jgi:hypothetical protein
VLAVAAVVAAIAVGIAVTSHANSSGPGSRGATTGGAATATTQTITYNGVQLTIPAGWPVIDGAHATPGCSSTFAGQADRAFLGQSYHGLPSCSAPLPGRTPSPSPSDGVWMQSGPPAPEGTATTLPGGQAVYLTTNPHDAVVNAWYHQVSIQIGIGADPATQRAILDSIAYSPGIANSAVLGRCPVAGPNPPTMPTPSRVTATVVIALNNSRIQPEPENTSPRVSAATVWHSFIHQFGVPVTGALQWSILYGNYSSPTPAHINPDGSTTPEISDVASWVIQARGVQTTYGPCGGTVLAPYNANTGHWMDYLVTSG